MTRLLALLLWLSCSLLHAADFLAPEAAFRTSARLLDADRIEVSYQIADGYYLYRERLRFSSDSPAATLGQPQLPEGVRKQDEYFGDVEVYKHELKAILPLTAASPADGPLALTLVLQGCAEAGLCYPPQTRRLQLERPAALSSTPASTAAASPPATSSAAAGTPALDETGLIASTLQDASLPASLAFFFLAGLGLALTPCVFPMIPILSGIIAGQGSQLSRRRGLGLSLAYVLGMALTYSAAGVAAGLSGTLISSALQTPWVLGSFAGLFVLLSLSMFGFYELQLPASLQSRLSDSAGRLQGGHTAGVFIMGALSALIVGPCVAAPLAGALLYIGQTGDALLGGLALFAMALGMGVPLLLVGLSAGTLLPRAGAWMESVKKFFGVLLLGTALWLISPVIPVAVQMLGWAALLIVPAIYLHALDPLPPHAGGWQRFWKGCGLVMVITGAALLVGVLAGNRDPLQPLAGLRPAASGQQAAGNPPHLPFQRVASISELLERIRAAGRPVMVDFYADWCAACKEMERLTFADGSVQSRLGDYLLLQADVTANSEHDQALLRQFSLFGPPGILFFDAGGSELRHKRVVGFQDVPRFLQTLEGL